MIFNMSFEMPWRDPNLFNQALPGHRYLVDLEEGEAIDQWWKGRREDVLGLPGKSRYLCGSHLRRTFSFEPWYVGPIYSSTSGQLDGRFVTD